MKLLWQAKMSSIQDWGEEVEEGAVYHVTLKRVQIQQAANKGARWLGVEGDQLPPGHTVSQYETCKIRTIKAGTLEKLVENLLTAFGDNDFTYISIFLSTYRGFASTKEVLELLLDRNLTLWLHLLANLNRGYFFLTPFLAHTEISWPCFSFHRNPAVDCVKCYAPQLVVRIFMSVQTQPILKIGIGNTVFTIIGCQTCLGASDGIFKVFLLVSAVECKGTLRANCRGANPVITRRK